jgi:hypothetical protein
LANSQACASSSGDGHLLRDTLFGEGWLHFELESDASNDRIVSVAHGDATIIDSNRGHSGDGVGVLGIQRARSLGAGDEATKLTNVEIVVLEEFEALKVDYYGALAPGDDFLRQGTVESDLESASSSGRVRTTNKTGNCEAWIILAGFPLNLLSGSQSHDGQEQQESKILHRNDK